MPETRDFHLGDILSITTGMLVSPTHMDGIYCILNWMTSDNLFTHQLPRAGEECREPLLGQHPDLADVQTPDEFDGKAHNAERKLDRANEALMRVRGVLHEGRSEAETLAIIGRAIAGPLSERDRDLEEARRARETADLHWGRAEQRAEKAETALAQLHAYTVHRRSCRADGAGEPCTCGLAALDLPESRRG